MTAGEPLVDGIEEVRLFPAHELLRIVVIALKLQLAAPEKASSRFSYQKSEIPLFIPFLKG